MSDASDAVLEKKMEELNLKFQNILGGILETHDASTIMQSILVMMGVLIQTIMLINFKKGGYLTNVEQEEIVNSIVHTLVKKTYSQCIDQTNELHPEWFEKKPPITRH